VSNPGSTAATGVLLTDVLPLGLLPVWVHPAHPVCERQGTRLQCNAGGFKDGDAITVTVDLSVSPSDSPLTATHLTGVSWRLPHPTCVVDSGEITSQVECDLVSLPPAAEVHVRVGVTADAGSQGVLLHTASVTAREADLDPADNSLVVTATVLAQPPAAIESRAGADAAGADLVIDARGPDTVVAGQPFTYTYTITNRGTSAADEVHFEDPLPPATTLRGYAPAQPRCVQRDGRLTCHLREPESGEWVTITLAVSGYGGRPVKLDLDPLMPGWPMCTVLKEREHLHVLTCELGKLAPGEAAHVQLGLIARGVQERLTTNTVSVRFGEADRSFEHIAHTATLAVKTSADLSIASSAPAPAARGEWLAYTLTVSNAGPSDAAGVEVVDVLPQGTRFVSATSEQGRGCRFDDAADADTVVCDLARLSAGATGSVTVVVAVDETLPMPSMGTIVHTASVIAEQPDPNLGNNEMTAYFPLQAAGSTP